LFRDEYEAATKANQQAKVEADAKVLVPA